MILAVASAGLRAAAVAGGLFAAGVAVYLAMVIPPRMAVESRPRPRWWWSTAVLVGGGFGWLAADVVGWWMLPAVLVFGGTTLAVTLIDLDHQLIPNRVLFPGLGVAAALLAVGTLGDGEGGLLLRAVLGAVVYFVVLLVVALVARGGFGMGDVKLALLLGLILGYRGWGVLAVGFVLAILMGGVASLLLLLIARRGRQSKFAYGPYLVAGAWIGLFWGQEISDWWLRSG